MLDLTIDAHDDYDETSSTFRQSGGRVIHLEHSLYSVSKWEAKWHQAFLGEQPKTDAMIFDYIYDMVIEKDVTKSSIRNLDQDQIDRITAYMNDPQSASVITEPPSAAMSPKTNFRHKSITAETLYARMIIRGVPIEFQYWNLHRLITLLRVIDIEVDPERKINPKQGQQWRSLENARRRKMLHSKG